jgi:TPR repeat protein
MAVSRLRREGRGPTWARVRRVSLVSLIGAGVLAGYVPSALAQSFEEGFEAVQRGVSGAELGVLRADAAKGVAVAEFTLGNLYARGQGVSQDGIEAARWLRRAADQGYVAAFANLGNLYARGEGVAKDMKQAVRWYSIGADAGGPAAAVNLGHAYYRGDGVAQDYAAAYRWFSIALNRGATTAASNRTTAGSRLSSEQRAAVDKEVAAWRPIAAAQAAAAAQREPATAPSPAPQAPPAAPPSRSTQVATAPAAPAAAIAGLPLPRLRPDPRSTSPQVAAAAPKPAAPAAPNAGPPPISGILADCEAVDKPDKAIPACSAIIGLLEGDPRFVAQLGENAAFAFAGIYTFRGAAYLAKNQPDLAIKDLTRAIEQEPPGDAFAHSLRGRAYYQLDLTARAIDDLTLAIVAKPDASDLTLRGTIRVNDREYEAAIADFTRAIELKPTEPAAYYGRATAHAAMGNISLAVVDASTALGMMSISDPRLSVANALLTDLSSQRYRELAPTVDLGCIPLADVRAKNTAADLFAASRTCFAKGQEEEAIALFALAGLYGRFDSMRVTDPSAVGTIAGIVAGFGSSLTAEEKTRFAAAAAQAKPDCAAIVRIGPPDYVPAYLVLRGFMSTRSANPFEGALRDNFDPARTWSQLLAEYLHCPP